MESEDRIRSAFAKLCGGTSTAPPRIREFITPIQCEDEPLVTDLLDDLFYYRFRQNPLTTIKQVLADEGFPNLSGESVLRLLSRELEQKHEVGVWTRRQELDEQFPDLRSFFANKLDGYDKDEFSSLSDWLIPDLSNTKYDDVQFFSSGGQSTVFSAFDPVLERRILLKCPRSPGVLADESSATPLERLHREAQILAMLEHPNVTTAHDLVTSHCGRLMLVMPEYARTTLRNLISDFHISEQGRRRFRSAAFSELLRHLEAICSAAAYAHDAEIIHRDLKPNNVLVDEFDQTVVIDWGLAGRLTEIKQEDELPVVSDVSSPKTVTQRVGTPGYIAPEVAVAPESASPYSDIFSIGVILKDMVHRQTR